MVETLFHMRNGKKKLKLIGLYSGTRDPSIRGVTSTRLIGLFYVDLINILRLLFY